VPSGISAICSAYPEYRDQRGTDEIDHSRRRGRNHRVVDAAERELAQSRRHYQRGGLIVTVVTDPGTRETRIQDVSQPALVRSLAGAALWERYDARAQDWVRTDPPARHAACCSIRPVTSICRC
jgi:hypothetical protein